MIVKKVTADSIGEAMKQIKRELGQDAIILNTRHIKVGGFFGLFAKKKVELVASVDEHVSSEPIVPKQTTSRKDVVETNNSIAVRPTIVTVGERPLPRELQHYAPVLTEPALQQVSERLHERLLTAYYQTQQTELTDLLTEEVKTALRVTTSTARYVMLTGPTGVGKTTTIAKLAAHHTLIKNQRVGLITTDTYRISAIEQLKTYADILGIPIHVAYDLGDFERAKQALASCDIVLVDTAGRNFLDEAYVEQLQNRHDFKDTDVFLVLSLTSKYRDLLQIHDRFDKIPLSGVVFSKADETSELWSMFGLVTETNLPIYCVTTGQEVPEDITFATADELSRMIVERGMR